MVNSLWHLPVDTENLSEHRQLHNEKDQAFPTNAVLQPLLQARRLQPQSPFLFLVVFFFWPGQFALDHKVLGEIKPNNLTNCFLPGSPRASPAGCSFQPFSSRCHMLLPQQ